MTFDTRRADLAKIHMAKKELGLEDDAYRSLLRSETSKASAADLTGNERARVLLAMVHAGWKPKDAKTNGRPPMVAAKSAGLIKKIEAQLTASGKPWAYAHGIAQRMFQLDKVEHCDSTQLRKIIAALTYDSKRKARKEAP